MTSAKASAAQLFGCHEKRFASRSVWTEISSITSRDKFAGPSNYQTLVNDALRDYLRVQPIAQQVGAEVRSVPFYARNSGKRR